MNGDHEDVMEDRRLIIGLGIVATSVGILAVNLPENLMTNLAKGTLKFSAILSFSYLLLSAASFKYKDHDTIGTIPFSSKFRKSLYDYSINVFGFNGMLALAYGFSWTLQKLGLKAHYYRWGWALTFISLFIYIIAFYKLNKKS